MSHDDPTGRRPRPRPIRARAAAPAEMHVEQLAIIAELMLAAAYADGVYVGVEVVAVAEQLKEFVEVEHLPSEVRRRIGRFDADSFDTEAACQRLVFETDEDRFLLLSLLANVVGADKVLHVSEVAYLKRVAAAIGLDPDQIVINAPD